MSPSRIDEPSNAPFFCFEVEFLVAQRKLGGNDNESPAKRTDETSTNKVEDNTNEDEDATKAPWTCAADCPDPTHACLEACAKACSEFGKPAAARYEEVYGMGVEKIWPEDRLTPNLGQYNRWLLTPSPTTFAQDGSLTCYNWVGIRLRSHFIQSSSADGTIAKPRRLLQALAKHIKIHVNSTCRFNVRVHLHARMDLILAKRVVTLVLMLEQNMLRPLCPDSFHSGRENLVFDVVFDKVVPDSTIGEKRPGGEPGAIMRKHIPDLLDRQLERMLNAV